MLGVINGTCEWIFAHPGRISVTISDAGRLFDMPRVALAQTIWREVAAEVAKDFPGIELEFMYADAATMWFVKNPEHFQRLQPKLAIPQNGLIGAEGIEGDVAFVRAVRVTVEAVFLENGANLVVEAGCPIRLPAPSRRRNRASAQKVQQQPLWHGLVLMLNISSTSLQIDQRHLTVGRCCTKTSGTL